MPEGTDAGTAPVARFRVRVTMGDAVAIGPGKVALLEAIAATGSITAAAASLEMSYRRAWLLIEEMNALLREPAVHSIKGGTSGGGSALTAFGQRIVDLYRHIEATATDACAADLHIMSGMLADGPPQPDGP